MIGVFTTGLTGVNAHQQWLDNIADNVSNVNSDGFKKTRTTFAELMSNSVGQATAPEGDCTMGGLNPKQIGTGVGNATMETIFTSGATKSTDNVTDLALAGDGFFVVNGGGTDLYTRNGNFGFDAAGNLTYKANGFKVQGFDEQGILGDIKVDMNDIMAPVATSEIGFNGEINKDQAQGLEDVSLDNGNTLKFKKVLGTDDTYNYSPVDADGNTVVATAASSAAADVTLSDTAGTITVNGEIFYLNNYLAMDDLIADVEATTGVSMSYENGVLTVAAATALDDLTLAETGDSLMGAKIDIDGTVLTEIIQDNFDGFGEVLGTAAQAGVVIGTVDGRMTRSTVDGTSTGMMVGEAGAAAPGRTATATGEIIGNLQGLFDGEGMAIGAVSKFEGYLKGVATAVNDDVDIVTPSTNAWIEGTVDGTSLGNITGTMQGYVDSTVAPSLGVLPVVNGDFKVNGHTVGFAQADTQKGVYGQIIGDAGISDTTWVGVAPLGNFTTLQPVTITGPGKVQGSVGGDYIQIVGPPVLPAGANTIAAMIAAGINPTLAASYDNQAALDNVTVEGSTFGVLTGNVTGELWQWNAPLAPGAWTNVGQVYGMNVSGFTGAIVGTFEGDATGIAQGDVILDDTSTVTGVVTGLSATGVDHDGNGVADAYITIDSEGSLIGDFEGQVDIYGEIFGDEVIAAPASIGITDFIRADVDVTGWLQGQLNGHLEGTVDGEARGEINGLIKHAAVEAQHFIGDGVTMPAATFYDHLDIKFEGAATGFLRGARNIAPLTGLLMTTSNIDNIILGLAPTAVGAYINGEVEGFLNVNTGANSYLLGVAEGTTTAVLGVAPGRIEGQITGEVTAADATLEGDYDGYLNGTGEVQGHLEGILGAAGATSSFDGEMVGTINNGHMVGWAEGFVENAGPVSGLIDLDNAVFRGTFKGQVTSAAGETIVGSLTGKMEGNYNGQIKAEKKDIAGLFSATNVAAGTYAATGGTAVVADGETATVAGEEVTANENYKINQIITVYDQLGQTTDLLVTLENTGDSEWNITTSDGGQGTLTFNTTDGSIASVDYDGQYELDLDSIVQVAGINEIIMSQDGNAKGHLQKDSLSIAGDGTISAMYDNGLSQDLGQVAVATFENNAGLTKAGGTMFAASQNSGDARVEEAGSIRSGSIASKTLEASNVNLTEELANMILAQQAFTAGIRMITTGDRLITEVMRMRP